MKSDLDALMQARHIDALLVSGAGMHNPCMVYLTGVTPLTDAVLIKKRGAAPVLFHGSMEREEAAKTGLAIRCFDEVHLAELHQKNGSDLLKTLVATYSQMLADAGVTSGRLAVYGNNDSGHTLALFSALQDALPGLEIFGEIQDSIFLQAMATKDEQEVAHIRRVGELTVQVVAQVADFLTSQRVHNETLVKPDGSPLTIGDVKSRIHLWLAERRLENPAGLIFSIGRSAAVPHTTGPSDEVLCLGQTIVFDIFPCEAGGGYFYDFTRTWCLGHASDEILALYEDVRSVYQQILAELRLNAPSRPYQERACELFEARGHPTFRSHPQTRDGYVHGLGHGVGLQIHESPHLTAFANETDRLAPGVVVTVEPGLYYPEQRMGVRLEDTLWMRPDGQAEILATYPLDLLLPIR